MEEVELHEDDKQNDLNRKYVVKKDMQNISQLVCY